MAALACEKLLQLSTKIVAVGRNYAAHAKELGNGVPKVYLSLSLPSFSFQPITHSNSLSNLNHLIHLPSNFESLLLKDCNFNPTSYWVCMSNITLTNRSVFQEPVLFLKPTSSYLENGGTIQIPHNEGSLHHEVELAVVIAKKARDVPQSSAMDYVAGK